ncbi:hypothetical protein GCM10009808_18080 [Microbacterium sediminicola]|uniref:ABC-2 type transporter transmembrane domain-containing protein n=1 Tax=Microbacterium sediminicola TaxID=415210 RepID=A0ABP4UBL0_9MICO
MSTSRPPVLARTPWPRAVAIALALSLVVGVVLLAFAWPAVTASPHDLPVGVVGTDEEVSEVTDAVAEQSDGAIALTRYDDRDAAVAGMEQREIYGAVILPSSQTEAPEVLKATAANPAVAQLIDGLAQTLQTQIDDQIRAMIESSIAAAQTAAAAQVQALVQAVQAGETSQLPAPGAENSITIPDVTVQVTDIVPLAASDPRGTGLAAAMFPLVMGGMIGGIGLTLLVKGGGLRRAIGVVVYAAAAGFVLAGILQGMFGALQGSFGLNALGLAVSVGAIASTITGIAGLIGPLGVGVGSAFTMLIANPISAATVPVQFIASPWGAIGQWLPPGAAATLVRNLSYFPDASTTQQWVLLIVWMAVGLALTLIDIPNRRLKAGETAAEHPLTV